MILFEFSQFCFLYFFFLISVFLFFLFRLSFLHSLGTKITNKIKSNSIYIYSFVKKFSSIVDIIN